MTSQNLATSDIAIARRANMRPITEIGQQLGVPPEKILCYGAYKAKIDLNFLKTLDDRSDGKLILVTAISPTPAGEGKTTTTVGLGDGLCRIGKKAVSCLREPSLGPCFGIKGGAAGGGHAQVVPMEDINLHFTGDFHAITSAHNLLSALIDNHIYWDNRLDLDERRIFWRRVIDMNDRALRSIINSLGGIANGFPRHDGFDITVASEVMAIFCLADSLRDLEERLGKIEIGQTRQRQTIFARQLDAQGAMTVLLKDALMPNLVQTLENNPVFIHGGPFANIAHGCNSVIATKAALKLSDYVVTEAGFGADLGAEKFFNIKCRKTGLKPSVAVLVATIRALKIHGGIGREDLAKNNPDAVRKGCANMIRHLENIAQFNVPSLVAINRFITDSEEEINEVHEAAMQFGVKAVLCDHWSKGSEGIQELAEKVVAIADSNKGNFTLLYPDSASLWKKITTIATKLYGAGEVAADMVIREKLREYERRGYGHLPICMAKTQYSFSTDPLLKGAPRNHIVQIREVRLSAGAGFIVVVTGAIMAMPGLPRKPAANDIRLNANNEVEGLF